MKFLLNDPAFLQKMGLRMLITLGPERRQLLFENCPDSGDVRRQWRRSHLPSLCPLHLGLVRSETLQSGVNIIEKS